MWVPVITVAVVLLLLAAALLGAKVAGPYASAGTLTRFASNWQQLASPAPAPAAAAAAAARGLGPTTDAAMMLLPPFFPTCKMQHVGLDTGKFGCPILSCRLDASCTITDPSCCAYLHYEMLTDFHQFLAKKCVEHEYVLAHGTALG